MAKEIIKKEDSPLGGRMTEGVNAQTGKGFTIPGDNPEWLKNRKKNAEGHLVITTPDGKELDINRAGMDRNTMAEIQLSSTLTREEKDRALADYLWQNLHDNSAALAELYQYKGIFIKDSRKFAAMIRFDFEQFVKVFITFLDDTAKYIFDNLGIEDYKLLKDEMKKYDGDLKKVLEANKFDLNKSERTFLGMAIHFIDEGESLQKSVDSIKQAREKEKGGGTYVSKSGKIYNLYDTDIAEIVRQEYDDEHKPKVDKQLEN